MPLKSIESLYRGNSIGGPTAYAPVDVRGHDGIADVRRGDKLLVEGVRVPVGGYEVHAARVGGVTVAPVAAQAALSHPLEHVQRIWSQPRVWSGTSAR